MAKRRKPAAGRTRGTAQPRRILATLPDALGAQSVIVVAGTQTKPLLALMLIKPDAGIADANIIRCHDRNEAAAILQEYRPLAPHELSIAMGRTLLSAALGDGVPAPDWPEAACVTGLNDLEPTPPPQNALPASGGAHRPCAPQTGEIFARLPICLFP